MRDITSPDTDRHVILPLFRGITYGLGVACLFAMNENLALAVICFYLGHSLLQESESK